MQVEEGTPGFSKSVVIQETRTITLTGVPLDLWEEYRDFCRRYARGDWTIGLQIAVRAAHFIPLLSSTNTGLAELEERVKQLEEKESEKKVDVKSRTPKTFAENKEE